DGQQRVMHGRGEVFTDGDGQPVRLAGTGQDVTEQIRSEKRFRALLESAPDAMVIVNERGEIVLLNAQTVKLFGYSQDDLLGQRVEILIPERFATGHAEHREHYASEPRARPMGAGLELYGRRKDGTEFPVEVSLSPLETEEGLLVTAAIRDIADRKRLEHEVLAVSEREQRRMGQDLHDGLCQQLAGIECMTRALQRKLSTQSSPESVTVTKVSNLLRDSIGDARRLAQGLFPVK